MAKYTTEVRSICEVSAGLDESVGYLGVEEVIRKAIPKVFNFEFPIFDEAYREVLETKILKHYYTREIGEETVGLWKLRLSTKLNEIMPYYNQLYKSELLEFNPLYNYSMEKQHDITRNGTNDTDITNISNISSVGVGKVKGSGEDWNLYSDTPQGSIENLDSETYLTNATKNTNENESNTETHTTETGNSENKNKNKFDNTENYLENVIGFVGKSGSELLLKYRETFLNIDMMIIAELESLFMQLW